MDIPHTSVGAAPKPKFILFNIYCLEMLPRNAALLRALSTQEKCVSNAFWMATGRIKDDQWKELNGNEWSKWTEMNRNEWSKWKEMNGDEWSKWKEMNGDEWSKWTEMNGDEWSKWKEMNGAKYKCNSNILEILTEKSVSFSHSVIQYWMKHFLKMVSKMCNSWHLKQNTVFSTSFSKNSYCQNKSHYY